MGAYHYSSYSATGANSPVIAGYQDELWAAEQCREAISALERAYLAPPLQMAREMKTAERAMEKMAERITEWQQNGAAGQNKQWETVMKRLNTARGLTSKATHPFSGVRRRTIEQAKDLLKSILVDELF